MAKRKHIHDKYMDQIQKEDDFSYCLLPLTELYSDVPKDLQHEYVRVLTIYQFPYKRKEILKFLNSK